MSEQNGNSFTRKVWSVLLLLIVAMFVLPSVVHSLFIILPSIIGILVLVLITSYLFHRARRW